MQFEHESLYYIFVQVTLVSWMTMPENGQMLETKPPDGIEALSQGFRLQYD